MDMFLKRVLLWFWCGLKPRGCVVRTRECDDVLGVSGTSLWLWSVGRGAIRT